jgi:hypothetical protein
MVLEVIKKQRESYLSQLDQTEKAIERTEVSLKALRNQMEQLKGAIFAADQVISTVEAEEKTAKAAAEAATKAAEAKDEEKTEDPV